MLARRNRVPIPAIEPDQLVVVNGDHITLGQLLKVAGIIGTGGEAKFYLSETVVIVNGEPEQRRGRKLRPGDRIQAPGSVPVRLIAAQE
ncbi:MAG: yaaA [Chthonomonadales bacterium]|nr:yaaA [Chthonomonadales bacterium]